MTWWFAGIHTHTHTQKKRGITTNEVEENQIDFRWKLGVRCCSDNSTLESCTMRVTSAGRARRKLDGNMLK